ncbi:hypothetical protein CPC08DRAFT_714856 [Agrocybe pediades]|nr:hypothetical protein CPC08DRAFT_714856 [Agrocybe pediades]
MSATLFLLTCISQYIQAVYGTNSIGGGILERQDASSDPSNTRSLWSIVSGCFATIFACTWISVHSNIPAPNDNPLEVLGRRLAIMLNLLIAPEFVIAWTARQYIASREISKRHKDRGWTKTHAFFVIMGGFALYENGKIVRTLDIHELEKLEAEGKIDWPEITEEDIKDKSKGDYFSKGVVVLQTCWFIAQVIARGVEHMVVTELEVVTLAFSALTMIIYSLWWNKPLDVGVPAAVHLKPGFTLAEETQTQEPDEALDISQGPSQNGESPASPQPLATEPQPPLSTAEPEDVHLGSPVRQLHSQHQEQPHDLGNANEEVTLPSRPEDVETSSVGSMVNVVREPPSSPPPAPMSSQCLPVAVPQTSEDQARDLSCVSEPEDLQLHSDRSTRYTPCPSSPPQLVRRTRGNEETASLISPNDIEMGPICARRETHSSSSVRRPTASEHNDNATSSRVNPHNAPSSPSDKESVNIFDIGREESWLSSKKTLWNDIMKGFADEYEKHNFIVATFLSAIGVIFLIGVFLPIYIVFKLLKEFFIAISAMVACTKLSKRLPTRVPTFYAPKAENEGLSYLLVVLVGIVFGSIHCIAWNFYFESVKEMWLWRINAVFVATLPVAIILLGAVFGLISGDEEEKDGENDDHVGWLDWLSIIAMIIIVVLIFLLIVAYIGARICLLVLPLYALRALPKGAYDDVDWTIFLPHFHI